VIVDGSEEFLPSPGAGGGVVRVGDTVRRLAEKSPEGMCIVLHHLESVGFDAAPRYLGTDESGRRIVTYIDGDVAERPYAPWVATDDLLVSVATLLRRYHDAVAGLPVPPAVDWRTVVPTAYGGNLVGHMDVSPANVVCRRGRAVGLIDFEEVAPADPIWDVARTVRHWVPLLDPVDLEDSFSTVDGRQAERLRLFADGYSLDRRGRRRLIDAALANADATYERMRRGAFEGHPGFSREWHGGKSRRNRRGRAWVAAHRPALTTALIRP
jgi:hypothetical protein